MTRGNPSLLVETDSHIEHALQRRLRNAVLRETRSVEVSAEIEQTEPIVAPERSVSDYVRPNLEGATSSIVRHPITVNNFELKPNFI